MDTPHGFQWGRWGEATERDIAALQRGQQRLRRDFDQALTRARRIGLLIVLWASAILVNAEPDRLAELVLAAIKAALRPGSVDRHRTRNRPSARDRRLAVE